MLLKKYLSLSRRGNLILFIENATTKYLSPTSKIGNSLPGPAGVNPDMFNKMLDARFVGTFGNTVPFV